MARKVLIYVGLAVVVVNAVIIAVVFSGGAGPAPRPMPNPNGYDDFVKAGKLVKGKVMDYFKMDKDELAALIATNAEALKLLRTGLTRECFENVDYSKHIGGDSLQGLGAYDVGLLPCAQGRLAELEGRGEEAAADYMDSIRFAQEFARGGIILSRLIANAIESAALRHLRLLINGLNGVECHKITGELEAIDAKEEPVEETMLYERDYARKTYGIRDKIEALIDYRKIQKVNEQAVSSIRANTLRSRRMILDFAARAYELEKGKSPQSAADLVPEYLKAIPKDPVRGKELGLGG